MSQNAANSVLRVQPSAVQTGIVCECCVHRCSLAELSQYCGGSWKSTSNVRRRRRSASRQNRKLNERETEMEQSPLTEKSVDEFYNLLQELKPYVESLHLTLDADVTEKLQALDELKRNNLRDLKAQVNLQITSHLTKSERRKLKQNRRRNRHHKSRHQKRG